MNIASPEFAGQRDDAWIPSTCALCYGTCSILVHRVDGLQDPEVVFLVGREPRERRRRWQLAKRERDTLTITTIR